MLLFILELINHYKLYITYTFFIDDADEFKQALIKSTYRSTFPNIFIDGKSIGGSDELATMHSNGRLSEILVDAGVLDSSEILNHEIFRPSL